MEHVMMKLVEGLRELGTDRQTDTHTHTHTHAHTHTHTHTNTFSILKRRGSAETLHRSFGIKKNWGGPGPHFFRGPCPPKIVFFNNFYRVFIRVLT